MRSGYFAAVVALAACTSASGEMDAGPVGRDAGPGMDAAVLDTGGSADSGLEVDAGLGSDAAAADTGVAVDAGVGDSGCPRHFTFTEVKDNVFVGCGGRGPLMGCHSRAPVQGDLDLNAAAAYAALVNVASVLSPNPRVRPGDPDRSFLWQKLTNAIPMDQSQGDPMPKGEAIQWQLPPADQLQAVRCWILQGAAND